MPHKSLTLSEAENIVVNIHSLNYRLQLFKILYLLNINLQMKAIISFMILVNGKLILRHKKYCQIAL